MKKERQDQLNKAVGKVMREVHYILRSPAFKSVKANPQVYQNISNGLLVAFDIMVGNIIEDALDKQDKKDSLVNFQGPAMMRKDKS
jgi:hypothetical protein